MAIRDYRPQTRAPSAAGTPEISVAVAGDNSGARALGRAISDVGATIEAARDEVQYNDARLAMVEGLGALNSELTEDQDFGTMRDRYGARLDELQSSVLDGISSPRQKKRMELEFSRARVGAEANVFRRQNMLEGGHARATLARTIRTTANSIPAAGSPEEASELYDTGMDAIASLEAVGHLSAEDAEGMRQGLDRDVSTALALDAINKDPAAAAETLGEAGAFGLDEIQRQRYLATATRTAESQQRQATTKLESRLNTARGVLVRGGVVDPADLATLQQDVAGTEYETQLAGAVKASEQLGNFYQGNPKERAAVIAETRARGISVDDASVEGAYLASLEAIDARAKQDLKSDPITYAMTAEMPGAGPLDLSDQASVEARMALVVDLNESHGAPVAIFSKAEREHYEDLLATGSVDDQLSFVVAVNDGFGGSAPAVYKELGGLDPAVKQAGLLVAETGSDQVARAILAGRKAQAAGDELTAPRVELVEALEEGLDGTLAAQPGRREEIVKAATAYYAAKAPGRVTADDPRAQKQLMDEAVFKVLGGSEIAGVRYGGVQEINGRNVKLPPTLSADNVSDLFDDASAEIWAAGSLTGNGPHEGDELTLPDRPVLQWVQGTTYRVGVRSRRGQVEWFQDPGVSNGFFYVDLHKMAEAQLRGQAGE